MTYPPQGPPYHGVPGNPFDPGQPGVDDAARRGRRRLTVALSVIVVVLAVVVGLGALKVYSEKSGNDVFPTLTLRSADDAGPDPFTSSVALTRQQGVLTNRAPTASVDGVQVVNGTAAGLYATNDTPSCDTARLGNDLGNDPQAAAAWASVIGIRPADIPWYLNTLSPVILTADTWVTNHAYRSGAADPFQSVLQAGTPVFVDAAGVPRVVCSCGNPLRPPAAAPVGGYRVDGHPWDHYSPRTITRVSTTDQHVTVVNNTTTVVNNPAPAPLSPLQVTNLVTNILDTITVGGTLNLPEKPADVVLPDPVEANQPVTFENADTARRQGLRPGSTLAETVMSQRASSNGNIPTVSDAPTPSSAPGSDTPTTTAPGTASSTSVQPTTSAPTTGSSTTSSAPSSTSATSPSSTSTSTTTSSTPTERPTVFTGTGDVIGSLTFDADGTSVTCTIPTTTGSSTVSATCTDDVDREFSTSALGQSAVTAAVSSNPVWTVTPSGGDTLQVTEARWRQSSTG